VKRDFYFAIHKGLRVDGRISHLRKWAGDVKGKQCPSVKRSPYKRKEEEKQ